VSEDVALLLELNEIDRRLRTVAGTQMWLLMVQDSEGTQREVLIETLDDIRETAASMLDQLEPPYDDENYGVQR
jgi:hypothetical protein